MRRVISVDVLGGATYRVTVEEGRSRSTHEVTADPRAVERDAPGVPAERLLEASFRFLLDREPKEAIEYPQKIRELV